MRRRSETAYAQIIQDAEDAIRLKWEMVTRLPKEAFFSGDQNGRSTEWAAMFLAREGWIPIRAYYDSQYFLPPKARLILATAPPDFDYVVVPHPKAVGRKCPECDQRKPLTKDFWHRNPDGKDGFYSICKKCVSKSKAAYYQRKCAA